MMRSSFILLSLCFLCCLCKGQQLPKITPASPEASSLGKYVNYPVNYGTGLVNIDIPLYEIKAGDMVLPVSISYHASGIKVSEAAGWIGLGWTLNAEPGVSRSIQGRPDETGYLVNNSTPGNWQQYLISVANGGVEEEPDEFYYKLLSNSGGFYFKKQPRSQDPFEIVIHPFEPLKITYNNSTPNRFEIIDEKGVYYRFGTSLNNTAYIEDTQTSSFSGNTSWKATEIISRSGRDTISFSYHPFNTTNYVSHNDKVSIEDMGFYNAYGPSYWNNCPGASYPFIKDMTSGMYQAYKVNSYTSQLELVGCGSTTDNSWANSSTVREQKLSQISFSDGKLVFEKDAFYNLLKGIKVYNNTGLLKEFRFIQTSTVGQRFQLRELHVLDAAGVITEKYIFSYNGNSNLPSVISKSTDHWGYYNGSAGSGAVPVTTVTAVRPTSMAGETYTFTIGGANKEPDPLYTPVGVLTSITYPTRGTTTFEYESNKYRVYDTPSAQYIMKNAGGLRISMIKDYDPVTGNTLTRTFKYGKNENGAGFIKNKLSSDDYMYESENYYMLGSYSASQHTRLRVYSSNSLADLFFSGGAPVVYDEVAEYRTKENLAHGSFTGKTVYKYNYSDNSNWSPPRIPGTTISLDPKNYWQGGQLLSKEDFKYLGAQGFQPVLKKSYLYDTIPGPVIPIGKVYRVRNVLGTPPSNFWEYEYIQYHSYNIYSGAVRPVSDTTIVMDGINPVVTTNSYTYGNPVHLYPTVTHTTTSDGSVIQTYQKFPHDISLSGAEETARLKLLSDWRINTVLEETKIKGGKTLITRNDYKVENSLALPSFVRTNSGSGEVIEDRLQYHTYNSRGRVTSVSKSNGPKVCYLYSYKGTYPIVEIQNAEYSLVESILGATAIENFSKKVNPILSEINTFVAPLRGQLSDVLITNFAYKPLVGITSMTDSKSMTTYYEYDSFQRLQHVKDQDGYVIKKYDYYYKP